MPIQQQEQTVFFQYTDEGNPTDQLEEASPLQRQYFGKAVGLGLSYGFADHWRIVLQGRTLLNTFTPPENRVGRNYGWQIDLGVQYEHFLGGKTNLLGGFLFSRIMGGYGLASQPIVNKTYLQTSKQRLYGKSIHFSLIDNSWSSAFQLGLSYAFSPVLQLYGTLGYQLTFGRQITLQILSNTEDGQPQRTHELLDNSNILLQIEQATMPYNQPHALPYQFGGAMAELGLRFRLYTTKAPK